MKKATRLLFVLSLSQSLLPQTWAQNATAIAATQLPSGGKVVGGQATLQSSGSTLNVNQTSQRGVVEWDTFNVGSKAKINFNQPSPSSVTLNRVMDMNASQILGRISATGQVFISNPNGIIFGTTAQVDVAGIVATTKSISNTDFLNGKTTFEGDGRTSSVINQGSLQAALGGYIALLAPHVRNEGIIVAREGTVALAAGDKTTLEFSGNKLVAVIVDRPVMDALVENKQLVRAEGGYVVLSARSANALLSSVIKQSGTIEAPSLVQREGRILLEGGEKGVVSTGGTLSVAGMQEGTVGGRIVATGDKVLVTQDAKLDATGQSGGGKINIGGGWQGKDPTIRQANAVQVEAGARLDASAIQTGNGGEIVVWSDTQKTDGMTRVAGDLKARGGAAQGDGGRIETSGHWLSTEGATGDASAKRGAAGQWLFDPYDITITSSATQGNAESSGTWTPSATG
jgi:fibronectin-binding autotransporter adhesin